MAILIKGMKKPENCANCPFDDSCFCTIGSGWDNCPLIAVEEKEAPNKGVYIFKTNVLLRHEDMERMRQELKRQIEDGVALYQPRLDFIARELMPSGVEIEVKLLPLRARAYTMEELEALRAGDHGLRVAVMVSDLPNAGKEDVSAILDWDFKQNELVAVWGYGSEPYRASDYMKKWAAYPYTETEAARNEQY